MKHPKLKVVHKEVNTDTVDIEKDKLINVNSHHTRIGLDFSDVQDPNGNLLVTVRHSGTLRNNALFLNDFSYDWIIGKDEYDVLCLVPVRKS